MEVNLAMSSQGLEVGSYRIELGRSKNIHQMLVMYLLNPVVDEVALGQLSQGSVA